MTWIRIDPNEMEAASRELQSCSDILGDGLTSLQTQCAGCAMPTAVSAQVTTSLATIERQLHDIRVELVLEATILAVRGILAIKGSAVAGALSMEVPAPTTGFVGGNLITSGITSGSSGTAIVGGNLITGGITSGSSGMAIVGGNAGPAFTITNADGTPAGPGFYSTSAIISAPTNPSAFGLDPRIGGASGGLPNINFESPFIKPEGNDFKTWANSRTRDSDGDGVLNGMDANPGSYDPAYTDHNSSTKPPNF